MRFAKMFLIVSWMAAAGCLALAPAPLQAQQERPLLMAGKKTLFQRVLTRPGAVLLSAPLDTASAVEPGLPAFTHFYVFARQTVGQKEWLQVGRAMRPPVAGWMPADKAIDWKQTIVVAFNNPAGRERSLLFRSREGLLNVVQSENMMATASMLRQQALSGSLPPDGPVVSIEPANHIDINERLYLLPILQSERHRLPGRIEGKVLQVASIPLRADPLSNAPTREELLQQFNVGIAFVIDTTTSMGPYIDRTRQGMERLYQRMARSEVADKVRFGLVGFRGNTEASPCVEYVTRIYSPLDRNAKPEDLLRDMKAMRPATCSTRGFDEESLAGVHEALTKFDWNQFGGRYIILITDAGPKEATDPLAVLKRAPPEISELARAKGVAIFTLHLKTPEGVFDHEYAESAYRALSRFDTQTLYHGVPNGSVEAFGTAVDQLGEQLIAQVNQAIQGQLANPANQPRAQSPADMARLVGLAMQLAYLGQRQGTEAPDVFEAWLLDRDLNDIRKNTLDVRVFLSKNQLATMRDVVKNIVETGSTITDPNVFFNQLRTAMAHMANDPQRVVNAEFQTLGDALGEYLVDLPYTSGVLGITERDWANFRGGRQRELLDTLKSKLRLYEDLHDTPRLWTELYPGAPPGEAVHPVPLSAMP